MSWRVVLASLVAAVLAAPSVSAVPLTYVGLDVQDVAFTPSVWQFDLPAGGALVEARVSLDVTLSPGADLSTLALVLDVPKLAPGGAVTHDQAVMTAADFTLTGSSLSGVFTTTALNGLVFEDAASQSSGLQLAVIDQLGGAGNWGIGDLRAEFDLGIGSDDLRAEWMDLKAQWMDYAPEPGSGLVLLVAGAWAARRRR